MICLFNKVFKGNLRRQMAPKALCALTQALVLLLYQIFLSQLDFFMQITQRKRQHTVIFISELGKFAKAKFSKQKRTALSNRKSPQTDRAQRIEREDESRTERSPSYGSSIPKALLLRLAPFPLSFFKVTLFLTP